MSKQKAKEPTKAPFEETANALAEPFREFVNAQSASGWLLLSVTFLALLISNSPWSAAYFEFIQIEFGLTLAWYRIEMSLQHWVADGLMAVFFFLLGLELKRELLVGQLSELRRASSVLCAAIGGMLLPALSYLAATGSAAVRSGWGIPVATDTAFALMVLTLLGPRVPVAARAFLVGLAIVDDLGAILIITFVYTGELQTAFLAPAGLCLAVLAGLNLAGIRTGLPYAFAGIVLWGLFTQLGVHGTLAGVVVALAAPVRPAISRRSFVSETRKHLRKFEAKQDRRTHSILEQPQQQELAQGMLRVAQDATVPLSRWETGLQLPISFIVMPLFALMNAGVELSGVAAWSSSSSLGIAAGLLFGKPLGIALGVWLGKKFGIAELPDSLGWRHLIGIGILGGIGFTMSLFIATLSFGNGAELLDSAKQAVIGTSLLAGIIGYAWLRWGTVAVR